MTWSIKYIQTIKLAMIFVSQKPGISETQKLKISETRKHRNSEARKLRNTEVPSRPP